MVSSPTTATALAALQRPLGFGCVCFEGEMRLLLSRQAAEASRFLSALIESERHGVEMIYDQRLSASINSCFKVSSASSALNVDALTQACRRMLNRMRRNGHEEHDQRVCVIPASYTTSAECADWMANAFQEQKPLETAIRTCGQSLDGLALHYALKTSCLSNWRRQVLITQFRPSGQACCRSATMAKRFLPTCRVASASWLNYVGLIRQ